MTPLEKNELYEKAIARWGILTQLDMCIEECSELIKAIQKLKRCDTMRQRRLEEMLLAEETTDVEIMCEQIRTMFKEQPFDHLKESKLERLKKRLGE